MTLIILPFVVFFVLLFIRMPVGFALGLAGFVGYSMMGGFDVAVARLALIAWGTVANFALSPLPLFVLMGEFMVISGLGSELYGAAWVWLGKLPAGLAVASVFACGLFAAMCGVSVAGAAAIGSVAIPEMLKHGYNKRIAAGALAAGGTLGILIPPSVPLIIYGIAAEQSIGRLFIAGVMPGVLLTILMSLYLVIRAVKNPRLAPPFVERVSWKDRISSLSGTKWVLLLLILVLGGIYTGIVTASEAGAVGALGAFVILLARKRLTWQNLVSTLNETVVINGFIFIIVVGAMLFGSYVTITGVTRQLADLVLAVGINRWVVIAGICSILLIMGMFLDLTSITLLTTPIFVPIVRALGFDLIWYGVVLVINLEMALITPPVAMNLFVIRGIAPQIPFSDIVWGALPYVIIDFIAIAIIAVFPQIALWLPSLMF